MRLDLVIGTRPEVTKTAAFISTLLSMKEIQLNVCLTGQQVSLVVDSLKAVGLGESTSLIRLIASMEGDTVPGWQDKTRAALFKKWMSVRPDAIVVQGDTTSALIGAECGSALGLVVCHLEAGIRHKLRRKDEIEDTNRRLITQLATLHFAPSAIEQKNLVLERVPRSRIWIIGDLSAASLAFSLDRLPPEAMCAANLKDAIRHLGLPTLDTLRIPREPYVLCSFHRFSTLNSWRKLAQCLRAVTTARINPEIALLCQRPDTRWDDFYRYVGQSPRLVQIPALPHNAFCLALKFADFVVTDSAGVQQEALLLEKYVIATRREVEMHMTDPHLFLVPPPFDDLSETWSDLHLMSKLPCVIRDDWKMVGEQAAHILCNAVRGVIYGNSESNPPSTNL